VKSTAETFHALADGTRRTILDRLQSGPASVGELVKRFAMTQPAVSQHLRVLREAGLVRVEARGRQRVYRLEAEALQPAFDWVAQYQRFWTGRLLRLNAHLQRKRP
jgi:DNA-binding transcriptional ArsR family regulator